jgi:hypothetical protein
MLQFWLKRGVDRTKHYWNMNRRQEAHLGSMGRSVTWCSGVTTSTRGEAAPRKGKGGDDASWTNANLTGPKNKKIHAFDSAGTNGR